jgi:hypothetical protein
MHLATAKYREDQQVPDFCSWTDDEIDLKAAWCLWKEVRNSVDTFILIWNAVVFHVSPQSL